MSRRAEIKADVERAYNIQYEAGLKVRILTGILERMDFI